jgi:hypothetical protein
MYRHSRWERALWSGLDVLCDTAEVERGQGARVLLVAGVRVPVP